jgi:hypothetical protein
MSPLVLSQLITVLPLSYSLYIGAPIWYSSLLLLQAAISIAYHMNHTVGMIKTADWIFATLLILANIYILIFHAQNTHHLLTSLLYLVPLIVIAFFFFLQSSNYEINHSIWHMCASIITIIVLVRSF